MPVPKEKLYTVADIYALPEGQRAELIDGVIYDMAPPSLKHERIVSYLHGTIYRYIQDHGGECEVFGSNLGVTFAEDDLDYFEPDVSVICDPSKLTEKGCVGAPDWIMEVVSDSTAARDNVTKLRKYEAAGVKIYTIIDPRLRTVKVYDFEQEEERMYHEYSFDMQVPGFLYADLTLDFSNF